MLPSRKIFLFLFSLAPVLHPLTGACGETFRFRYFDLGKTENVSCIDTDSDGRMWICLDGGGLMTKESIDSPVEEFSKMAGTLPTDVTLCTYRDRTGRRWFGSYGDGVFFRENGSFVPMAISKDSCDADYCTAITDDRDTTIWLGTIRSGIFAIERGGGIFHLCTENSGLRTNNITDIKCYADSVLFIATGWGLYSLNIRERQIKPVMDDRGEAFMDKKNARTLMIDGHNLWIGSKTGVYVYNLETLAVRRLPVANEVSDDIVKAICKDQRGYVWITSTSSVARVGPDFSYVTYGEKELGQLEFHVRAAICTADGNIFLGTTKGLLSVSPVSAFRAAVNPYLPLFIAGLLVLLALFAGVIILRRAKKKRRKQGKTTKGRIAVEATPVEVSSVNVKFVERAKALVEEHISEADYSVENLSRDMGMTRGNLYKRMEALTGLSPIEFMRKLKIERGRQLVEQSGETVSQTAWRVGLSPKQFSKYFRQTYGFLPSDKARRAKKKDADGRSK